MEKAEECMEVKRKTRMKGGEESSLPQQRKASK